MMKIAVPSRGTVGLEDQVEEHFSRAHYYTLIDIDGDKVVIDGCHNECARRLLEQVGIIPDAYLNLEQDLHLNKQGPFTSLDFTSDDVPQVADAITTVITALIDLSNGNRTT